MEGYDNKDVNLNERDEIFSKAVRAGKRTYFFDVKATRNNDYYLTVTESKKRFDKEGGFHYEKHKIFLYKEDFEKFADGLQETVGHIRNLLGNPQLEKVSEIETAFEHSYESEELDSQAFVNVEFEDLER
ncbi:MAG: DUF3276 family protein [Marinifilaceae bacterium]